MSPGRKDLDFFILLHHLHKAETWNSTVVFQALEPQEPENISILSHV